MKKYLIQRKSDGRYYDGQSSVGAMFSMNHKSAKKWTEDSQPYKMAISKPNTWNVIEYIEV